MEEYKYIEFLIEDKSGAILVEHIMKKYREDRSDLEYSIHGFKGIGKIPQKITNIGQIKTHRLLTDLPMYLKGMDSRMRNMLGKKAIFVILDSDDDDCAELKRNMVQMYEALKISIPVFFCIAIEEMEAWLLGDCEALVSAYPNAKRQLLSKYVSDSIIGTWEYLADVVYKGGVQALKRNATSYYEIGMFKCECADRIGQRMDLTNNASYSFNYFIKKLDAFCGDA